MPVPLELPEDWDQTEADEYLARVLWTLRPAQGEPKVKLLPPGTALA